jgi:hypothetical protein
MRQTWHIFRKDVRRLWLPILLASGAAAYQGWVEWPRADGWYTSHHNPLPAPLLISVAWLYLIARLIHQEALPGDRQFWLTRPYSRASLFAAKAAFLPLFLHLPLLISNAAVLHAAGFELAPLLPGLLWRQAILAGLVTAPALALASVTRGLAQFAAGSVLLLFCLPLAMSISFRYFGLSRPARLSWLAVTVMQLTLLIGGACVAAWQYRTRRTSAALAMMLAFAGLALASYQLPGKYACALLLALQPEPAEFAALTAGARASVGFPAATFEEAALPPRYYVEILFQFNEVPNGMLVQLDEVSLQFEGHSQASPWQTFVDGRVQIDLDKTAIERIRTEGLRTTGTVYFSLVRERPLPGVSGNEMWRLPGYGICSPLRADGAPLGTKVCFSPFRGLLTPQPAARRIKIPDEVLIHLAPWQVHSPLPADPGFGALERELIHPWVEGAVRQEQLQENSAPAQFGTRKTRYSLLEPVARLRRDFSAEVTPDLARENASTR